MEFSEIYREMKYNKLTQYVIKSELKKFYILVKIIENLRFYNAPNCWIFRFPGAWKSMYFNIYQQIQKMKYLCYYKKIRYLLF